MGSIQKVNLLGSSFSLKVDEDPAYFQKVIQHIEKVFSDVESSLKITDPLRVALLSCIMITDDLLKERERKPQGLSAEEAEKAEQMTLEIIHMIDKNLD